MLREGFGQATNSLSLPATTLCFQPGGKRKAILLFASQSKYLVNWPFAFLHVLLETFFARKTDKQFGDFFSSDRRGKRENEEINLPETSNSSFHSSR